MARDNFNRKTIEKLRARVAGRCSNPDCRVLTTAASGSDGVNNIGIAAHIYAASPGGPRYDEKMTITERAALYNGIWLCSNCSIKIDRDVDDYNSELLLEWKSTAEKRAKEELGKKLPSQRDAIDLLMAASNGSPAKTLLASSISNVHQAFEETLENIDPRFAVKSTFTNGASHIELMARENIPIGIKVNLNKQSDYLKKYRALLDHGHPLEVDLTAIQFEGSPLFEAIHSDIYGAEGRLIISPHTVKAVTKISVINKESGLIDSIDDAHGEIYPGGKSFRFSGSAMSNILKISYSAEPFNQNSTPTLNISWDLSPWDNREISRLPFLKKMLTLFERLCNGWNLAFTLEIDGESAISGTANLDDMNALESMHALLIYSDKSRRIAEFLRTPIRFKSDVNFTWDDLDTINEIVNIIDGKVRYLKTDISSNPIISLIFDDKLDQVEFLKQERTDASLTQSEHNEVTLFGVKLAIPPRTVHFEDVSPKLIKSQITWKNGDIMEIELVPGENFSLIYELKTD